MCEVDRWDGIGVRGCGNGLVAVVVVGVVGVKGMAAQDTMPLLLLPVMSPSSCDALSLVLRLFLPGS